jgi:hypothetical protein
VCFVEKEKKKKKKGKQKTDERREKMSIHFHKAKWNIDK